LLFFASKDTYVYQLDAKTGNLLWKYQAGAKLEKGPQVAEKVVYQYARNKGLSAINKETGERLWQMADGVDLLAKANDRAYVITKTGMLIVMDNRKTKQLYSVDFAAVSRYASNVADSKIYIADTRGRIACLKPIEW
jgi:outer membrane protein assembly factor BamB